jgi:hypothetical protein
MKEYAIARRLAVPGAVSSLLVLWAVLVIPGAPFMHVVAGTAVATLALATTVLCLGRGAALPAGGRKP